MKSLLKNKTVIIITAVLILSFIIAGVFAIISAQRPFDYMRADLSDYINLEEDDYRGFSKRFDFEEPTEHSVDRMINALLCENRLGPRYNGGELRTLPIEIGSTAKIYYRASVIGENGAEREIASNFSDGEPYSLTVGAGEGVPKNIVPELEEALVGIVPSDYAKFPESAGDGKLPLICELKFSETYEQKELRGKTVKYEIYISGVVFWDLPEYNGEFITKTLKITEHALSGYEGNTLTEKHRAKLFEQAVLDWQKALLSVVEEEIWEYLISKAEIKKLPESEVEKYFSSEYESLYNTYSYYQGKFNTLSEFASEYYNLSPTENYTEHITALAEETVAKKLILYRILKNENLIPKGEEYDRLYAQVLEDYLAPFIALRQSEIDGATTDEEREALMNEIRQDAILHYGDDFFKTSVYYNTVTDKLLEWYQNNTK